MKFNKIMFLTIVLLTILSVGAVSAQDISADDAIQNSQDETIQLNSDNDDSLSAAGTYDKTVYVESSGGSDSSAGSQASPYATINKAIESVNASDNAVIYLGSGTFTGENNTNLEVNLAHKNYNGSLTIIGKGNGETVIDANNEAPIFKAISADSIVTLINLTFTNGKNDMGSVITSDGDVSVDNCVFEKNYVTNLGAIYSKNGDLTITNSKFYKNYGNQYVDLYFAQNGLVTLINNIFESGTATSSWADTPAVYVGNGKSVIKGNTFKNLTSSRSAAALAVRYNNGDNIANITDNTFVNCTYTGSNGGIIFFQNSYLKGNKFIDCTSTTALLNSVTDFNSYLAFEDVKINGTRFVLKANVTDDQGNKVQGAKVIFNIDGKEVGSATSNASGVASITINKLMENGEHSISGTQSYSNANPFEVTVINGSATVDFDHSPAEVWVSTEGNDTSGDGSETNPFLTLKKALDYGTAATVDLTVHIKNGLYNGSQNRDLSYSNVGKITIIGESYGNVIVDAENAVSGSGWSARASSIFTFGQNLEIKLLNLTLINCKGNPVSANTLTMNDNVVINSSVIRAQSPNEGVFIDNLKFINGTGQAINTYNLVLTNSLFENCNGGTSTGLLWISANNGNIIHLENNTFKANTIAGYSGGAAYYVQGDFVSINNTFDSNTVTGTASNVAYAAGNSITSINDKFINNTVPSYIAQYRSNGNNPTEIIVENITMINNTASANGAGLVTTGAKIKGGKFINNTAAGEGGAIYLLNHGKTSQVCEMSIEDVTFKNNTAASGNDVFIAPGAGNNVFANLTDLTITANSQNVTELSDTITVTVSHPSGAIIGGGQVIFYFNDSVIGKVNLINQNATFEYVGFKNNTEYNFTSFYEYATENDTYVNGVISTNIAYALDSVELYVSDSLGDDENGNGSENNPFKSISKALTEGYAKSTNITVHVLEGNYTGKLNTNLRIPTTVDVLITGENADKVIISDSEADYFITALSGSAKLTLANLTVNRAARDTQSAIYVEEGVNMEIDHVTFIGGQGNYGGAINTAGTLIIYNSYFFDNGYADVSKRANAYYGGAICNDGILIIDNSTFEANHAGRLSTIANQGTLYMNNSKVIDSISANAMNMDLVAIGAFGGQKGNITIENSIFTVTNRTVAELSNRIYQSQNSLTCLAIGSSEHATIINSTFEDKGGRYTPNAFGGINSWVLAMGGYTILPGDLEVYNSTFRNLQSVSLFYTRTDGSSYHSHRVFDGCVFENVEYLIAVLNSGDNLSVNITNSIILSDNVTKIGIAPGKTIDMNISNNWWGSNNATYKNATVGQSNFISNYVIKIRETSSQLVNPEDYLVLTLNQTGNDVELAFKVFDGENLTDYEGSLPAREFTINATGATVGINNGTITNAVVIPISTDALSYIIQATVDNETVNLTVVKKDTQINVIAINDDLSITGTLTDNDGNPVANVNITYSINDVVENITTDENGEFNIPCLANGEVLMEFSGNNFNLASNKTFTFNGLIKQEVIPEIAVPSDLNAGDEAIIIVSVPDATGNVTLIIDGEEHNLTLDENGIATYTIDSIAAGNHSITAVYPGDNKIAPASASATINNVAKEDVIPTIETEDDVKAGDSTVVTVTVPDATGDITLIIDGEEHTVSLDADGVATYTIDDITAGNHSIVAIYAGDDKINPVTATQSISVSKAEANIEASAEDITEDEPATIEVTVDGDATGIVLVDIGGKKAYAEINNGKATITIDALKANNYTVIVTYNGNDKYDKVNTTVKFQVTAKPVSNETNNTENNTPAVPENVTVVVNGVNYTVPVVNGTVVVNVPVDNSTGNNTPAVPENVTVVVNGVNYTAPVVNGTVVVNVPVNNSTGDNNTPVTPVNNTTSPAELNVTVPNSINAGENATVTVKAPANATGNITVKVDGKEIATVPLVNGSAEVPLNNLTDGAHLVEVTYSGDDQYAPNTVANAIAVSDAVAPTPTPAVKKDTFLYANATLTRVANDNTKTGEKGGDYYVTLKDADGNALVNKTVQIAINGVHYYVQTDENGMAHQQVNMESANVYTYAFAFQGDDDYNAAPLNSTRLTVTKKTTSITGKAQTFKKSAKTKKVVVTLSTSKNPFDGKTYLSSGKKLTLTVAGKTYTAKTNAKNQATFKIKLTKKGKYTAKVKFAGSKIYAASSAKVKITIK